MSRINVSGGGGLTKTAADGLYVKQAGDTMTGNLQMGTPAGSPPNIVMQGIQGSDTGVAPKLTFQGKDSGLVDISGEWILAWSATDSYMRLQGIDGRFLTDVTLEIYSSATENGLRIKGQTYPRFDDTYDLGLAAARWKNLRLSGDITVKDEVSNVGDSTNGVRQVVFSDAQTGSNRAAFRGCKMVATNADVYWGIDDVFPGFYVQKSVVSGSTATDNSQDYSNLYQGDSTYPYLALNYAIARTADGSNNPTNGIVIGDSGAGTVGSPLIFKAGLTRFVELYLDQTNSIFRIECGKTTGTRIPKIEIRLAGTGPSIRPYSDNLIDFGESSLMWKDGYFKGDVRQRQAICTGDNAGVASTNSFTNVSDLTTNSTGVGTILFKGTTSRNSTGFIKIYVGTTAYYVPVFAAITG